VHTFGVTSAFSNFVPQVETHDLSVPLITSWNYFVPEQPQVHINLLAFTSSVFLKLLPQPLAHIHGDETVS
jgi:hypothetical protein